MITAEIKDDATKAKGYFIYPSQLFANVATKTHSNEKLNNGPGSHLRHHRKLPQRLP